MDPAWCLVKGFEIIVSQSAHVYWAPTRFLSHHRKWGYSSEDFSVILLSWSFQFGEGTWRWNTCTGSFLMITELSAVEVSLLNTEMYMGAKAQSTEGFLEEGTFKLGFEAWARLNQVESGKKILWCHGIGRSPHAGGTGSRLVCLKCRGCGVSVVMMLGLGGHVGGLSFTLREWRKPLQCLKPESEGIRGTVWKRDANSMEDELDRDKTARGDI